MTDYIPVEETKLLRYARFRGRKVRVIGYMPKTEARTARFVIIDHNDEKHQLSRSQISFIKENHDRR